MELKENRISECELNSSDVGYGPAAGSCKDGSKLQYSIKGGEFLDNRSYN
jgi:hypothetical protein